MLNWGLRRAVALPRLSAALHASPARLAITTVNVPSMGDSISEGTLVQIVKSAGEPVYADEVVAVLETDKVSVDVMSPVAGTVVEHLAKLEENVAVGRALFTVDDSRAPPPRSQAPSTTSAPPSPTPAAPAAAAVAVTATPHRTPLIKFLGKRALLPTKATPSLAARAAASPLASVQPSGPGVLPFNHVKRVPLTSAEVDAINSGVAFL
ncbi:hypothetical protein PybrP1_002469 [[Pythium] brassicae (nom. inval.)]|nr:hypothetical protein PybrP1_002469 [[Pythium] brassicae (nom. inval.)]